MVEKVDTSIKITSTPKTVPFEEGVKLFLRRSERPTDETGILAFKEGEGITAIWIHTEDVPKLIDKLKEVME